MNRFSIRSQLMIGFGLVIAIFVISSSLVSMRFKENVQNGKWTTHTYNVLLQSRDILTALVNIETGQRGYLLAGEESFLEPLHQGERNFNQAFEEIKQLTSDNDAQQQRLERLRSTYETWRQNVVASEIKARRAVAQGTESYADVVEMVRKGSGKSGMDSMRSIVNEIAAEEQKLLDVRATVEIESQSKANWTLILSSLIGIIAGIAIAAIFSARLIRQLGAEPNVAAKLAQEISEGQLNVGLSAADVPEDSVMAAMLRMAKQLKTIVAGIENASDEVETTSSELSAASERSIRDLRLQKEEAEQVATAMNEMAATVAEVARNTQYAAEATQTADQRVLAGGQLMESSVKAIITLHDDIENAAAVVLKLEAESREIVTVLEVIRSIAEQTNLLALNAAIEAARAGEQGRGFAVVADEVRSLASKTHQSTEEIRSMIDRLQAGVQNVVKTMETSRSGAKTTVTYAKEMDANLLTIKTTVSEVNGLNIQIATAAEEQSLVAEEINKNILKIYEVTDMTVATLTQVDRSGNDLKSKAADLRRRISYFKH